MRKLLTSLAAALVFAMLPSSAAAQLGYWQGHRTEVPYVTPFRAPPTNYTYYSTSPWGVTSVYNSGTYPTPWGYNTYQDVRSFHQPIVTGPLHSVYFDPRTYTYQYAPGYLNAPRYSYRYWYGY